MRARECNDAPLLSLTAGMSFKETKDYVEEWPGSTPWTAVTYTFTTPGDYWLVFGVENVGDREQDLHVAGQYGDMRLLPHALPFPLYLRKRG